jgi:hypothetical protein
VLTTAIFDVAITLRTVSKLTRGEPIQIRSVLGDNGERSIRIALNAGQTLVSRSLSRADTLVIRFLVAAALAEFVQFWSRFSDGKALRASLIKLTGIAGGYWGVGMAGALAETEAFHGLDRVPIYGPASSQAAHVLFVLPGVKLRELSDICSWRNPVDTEKEAVNG